MRLHQQPNARAPSRTIAGATPAPPSENSRSDVVSVSANRGWSIIVRMNTGVLIITAMRSRSSELERAARLPRVHQHRGDPAR